MLSTRVSGSMLLKIEKHSSASRAVLFIAAARQ
jgi:hypothetical protein